MDIQIQPTDRRYLVGRQLGEQYAELITDPDVLRKRIAAKDYTIRSFSKLCGHKSHSHIYALLSGGTKTTSIETAKRVEAMLDARGLFFAKRVQLRSRTTGRRKAAA